MQTFKYIKRVIFLRKRIYRDDKIECTTGVLGVLVLWHVNATLRVGVKITLRTRS